MESGKRKVLRVLIVFNSFISLAGNEAPLPLHVQCTQIIAMGAALCVAQRESTQWGTHCVPRSVSPRQGAQTFLSITNVPFSLSSTSARTLSRYAVMWSGRASLRRMTNGETNVPASWDNTLKISDVASGTGAYSAL
jgi:hypothetical protein